MSPCVPVLPAVRELGNSSPSRRPPGRTADRCRLPAPAPGGYPGNRRCAATIDRLRRSKFRGHTAGAAAVVQQWAVRDAPHGMAPETQRARDGARSRRRAATLGLVVSTFARSQLQAFKVAQFTILPAVLPSGFMIPFDGRPRLAQRLAQVPPLTHSIVMIRGIVLRGAGLAKFWPQRAKLATLVTRAA